MFSLHTLSLHYKAPPFLSPSIFLRNKPKTLNSQLLSHRLNYVHFEKRKAHPSLSSASRVVCSVEKESEQYEVDPDKAREALKNLDQQIQSLSQKQTRSSKLKAPSNLKFTRDETRTTEGTELISESSLAYTAIALIVLTIFYNVLFITVIKPSIDIPDQAPSVPFQRQLPAD